MLIFPVIADQDFNGHALAAKGLGLVMEITDFTEEELSRVHGPIGLDLGSRGAEETALGILAEVTAVRFGGSGVSMRAVRA